MKAIRTNILTPFDQDNTAFFKDYVLICENDKITALHPYDPKKHLDVEDRTDCLCLPGFIDIHVHLSQYRIRGRFEPSLLQWLEKYVFPEEALSQDHGYAAKVSEDFFNGLFAVGTTTSVIYTAPFTKACEIAFETALKLGARAFIGMTMMDQNCPGILLQTADNACSQSEELFHRFHNSNPLLSYIFTPRFALACSAGLMKRVGRFAGDHSAWIQTHLSENKEEVQQAMDIFGCRSYTEVYEEMGLLSSRTILAHAIHISESEMDLLSKNHCRLAHCPDSNFFLKSGEFNYPALADKNLSIGIGSDVGAGTSLNMLYHAKQANFRQSTYSLKPERLFYHITLGNAKLLELDDRIGSLAVGKEADLCFLKMPFEHIPDGDLLSTLCFCGHEFPIVETIVAGRSVYTAL